MADRSPRHDRAASRSTARTLDADIDRQLESVVVVDRLAHARHVQPRVPRPGAGHPAHRPGSRSGRRSRSRRPSAATTPEPLIDGEVTSIESEYDHLGIAGGRARLRPVPPPRRGPQDPDVPERQATPTSPSSSRAAPGSRPKSTTPGGTLEHRPPGEPVRPRLPLRPRAPDRLRLSRRRDEALLQEARPNRPTRRRPAKSEPTIRSSSSGARTCSSSGRA